MLRVNLICTASIFHYKFIHNIRFFNSRKVGRIVISHVCICEIICKQNQSISRRPSAWSISSLYWRKYSLQGQTPTSPKQACMHSWRGCLYTFCGEGGEQPKEWRSKATTNLANKFAFWEWCVENKDKGNFTSAKQCMVVFVLLCFTSLAG